MAHSQGQVQKAVQGFTWTLDKLAAKIRSSPDDIEIYELWGLGNDQ